MLRQEFVSKLRSASLAAAAIATLVLIPALAPTASAAPCSGGFTMLYNGSVQAELVDCGCKKRPLGGLARRAHLIDQIQAEHSHTLMVDAGNLFGDPSQNTLARSRFVAAETAAMGYDVIGVGPYELGHGVDTVLEVAAATGLHIVNANLSRDDAPVFDRYRIIEVGAVRVGVTGVLDPAFLQKYAAVGEDIDILDPVESLRELLPEIRRQADVVVVLSNLKSTGAADLVLELGDDQGLHIDYVVDGISGRALDAPQAVASTEILMANNRGKRIGQIDVELVDGVIVSRENEVHALDIHLPEDLGMAARVEAFQAEAKAIAASR